jgi:hypothetical protein
MEENAVDALVEALVDALVEGYHWWRDLVEVMVERDLLEGLVGGIWWGKW